MTAMNIKMKFIEVPGSHGCPPHVTAALDRVSAKCTCQSLSYDNGRITPIGRNPSCPLHANSVSDSRAYQSRRAK